MTVHQKQVAALLADGWQIRGWRRAMQRLLVHDPWLGWNDAPDTVDDVHIVPDAWRVDISQSPEPRLVLKFVEVEVTYAVSDRKLRDLEDLCRAFDVSENMRFECWSINRRGAWSPIVVGLPFLDRARA